MKFWPHIFVLAIILKGLPVCAQGKLADAYLKIVTGVKAKRVLNDGRLTKLCQYDSTGRLLEKQVFEYGDSNVAVLTDALKLEYGEGMQVIYRQTYQRTFNKTTTKTETQVSNGGWLTTATVKYLYGSADPDPDSVVILEIPEHTRTESMHKAGKLHSQTYSGRCPDGKAWERIVDEDGDFLSYTERSPNEGGRKHDIWLINGDADGNLHSYNEKANGDSILEEELGPDGRRISYTSYPWIKSKTELLQWKVVHKPGCIDSFPYQRKTRDSLGRITAIAYLNDYGNVDHGKQYRYSGDTVIENNLPPRHLAIPGTARLQCPKQEVKEWHFNKNTPRELTYLKGKRSTILLERIHTDSGKWVIRSHQIVDKMGRVVLKSDYYAQKLNSFQEYKFDTAGFPYLHAQGGISGVYYINYPCGHPTKSFPDGETLWFEEEHSIIKPARLHLKKILYTGGNSFIEVRLFTSGEFCRLKQHQEYRRGNTLIAEDLEDGKLHKRVTVEYNSAGLEIKRTTQPIAGSETVEVTEYAYY